MGQRGPRPKPTAAKLLTGTFRKDRAIPNEPQPEVVAPSCPPHLSGLAKKEWKRLVPELLALGLLTKIDRAALAAYCQCWARWVEAEEKLKVEGLTIKTPSGFEQPSAWLTIANKALALLRAYAAEFGLSPATRARVSAAEPPKRDNPFNALDRYLEQAQEKRFFG
jgi:P27 family predicted phage terminase small subunit